MSGELWDNDAIQFRRLLAEFNSLLEHEVLEQAAVSMDLGVAEIQELLERAELEWERIKDTPPNILAMHESLTAVTGFTPPDFNACQTVVREAHDPFVFGPRPNSRPCGNPPSWLALESEPDDLGRRGSMCVCDDCRRHMPPGAILFPITRS